MSGRKFQYSHHIDGDLVKVEIRDMTYKVEYRKKFNVSDANSWIEVLDTAESYGLEVSKLIQIMLKRRGIDIAPHF